MKPSLLFLVLLPLCGVMQAQPQWQVESASVTFEIKNAGLRVHGSFTGLEADVRFDPEYPERSAILASIDASTVDTGIGLRNKHLRKREYFHVDQYPRIRMESVRMEKRESDTYSGTFLLDLKGIQREVTVPFTFTPHGQGSTFMGSFMINRLDFGVGESSIILADDITVRLTIEVLSIDQR
ncbi:MAG: YceI family protein [Gemmatimonadetes bacterium]|nr:YceI family protein [Gemmatimonadota bacterium]